MHTALDRFERRLRWLIAAAEPIPDRLRERWDAVVSAACSAHRLGGCAVALGDLAFGMDVMAPTERTSVTGIAPEDAGEWSHNWQRMWRAALDAIGAADRAHIIDGCLFDRLDRDAGGRDFWTWSASGDDRWVEWTLVGGLHNDRRGTTAETRHCWKLKRRMGACGHISSAACDAGAPEPSLSDAIKSGVRAAERWPHEDAQSIAREHDDGDA